MYRHTECHPLDAKLAFKSFTYNIKAIKLIGQQLLVWLLWTRGARKELCHSNSLASGFPAQQAVHYSATCAHRASIEHPQLQFLEEVQKDLFHYKKKSNGWQMTVQEGKYPVGMTHKKTDQQLLLFIFT